MSDMQSTRAGYDTQILRMLWPAAEQVRTRTDASRGSNQEHRQWLPLPSSRRPTALVPLGVPGAGTMLDRSGATDGRARSLARTVVQHAVASRHIRRLPLSRLSVAHAPGSPPAPASIADHLIDALGQPLDIGILLGRHRANQKPVLRLFDHHGQTVAFVKVGHTPLARALVRRETQTLHLLAGASLAGVRTPQVLDASVWNDLEVLVLSPLTSKGMSEGDQREMPLRAMREVAHVCGTTHEALAQSNYWARARELAVPHLCDKLSQLVEQHGDQVLQFGSWHGDWAPWNMNWSGQVAQVWDWERFERDVPVGFDALHFHIQSVRHDSQHRRGQEARFLGEVPGVLEAMGVPACQTQLTLVLYLLSIAQRYTHDAGTAPGSPLEPRRSWVVGLLQQELARLLRQASEKGAAR